MGITTDQKTRSHLNRLHKHYKAMEGLKDDWGAREELELHAWAFARILLTSDYLKHLLSDLLHCHQHNTTVWEMAAQMDPKRDANEPSPVWALELVELILRTCNLLEGIDLDHNSEFYGASDALDMIEKWMPYGPQTNLILLAIPAEDYERWGGDHLNPYSWVGFPNLLRDLKHRVGAA